jgi:membrane protease YdiL (CAAX protease family)
MSNETRWEFRAPPGWPAPPPGWVPPPGWQPDPLWPAAPAGWQYWQGVPVQPAVASPAEVTSPPSWPGRRTIIRELLVVAAVFPLPFVVSGIIGLVQAAAGLGGGRLQILLPGHPAGSAVLLTLTIAVQFAPAALIWYLLGRSGETMRDIGLDRRRPWQDGLSGIALAVATFVVAAVVGDIIKNAAPGASYHLALGGRFGMVYLLPGLTMALWAATIEEIVVAGYLLHRLDQLGVPRSRALLISTAVRTSYHLYYGLGALMFIPLGLMFGWTWQRYKRLVPLVVAHAIYDGVLLGLGIALSG